MTATPIHKGARRRSSRRAHDNSAHVSSDEVDRAARYNVCQLPNAIVRVAVKSGCDQQNGNARKRPVDNVSGPRLQSAGAPVACVISHGG